MDEMEIERDRAAAMLHVWAISDRSVIEVRNRSA